jgi:hypothetical protein
MLSTNVGSISLDCQISTAGHPRPGIRADGDAVRRRAGDEPLPAPARLGKRIGECAWESIRSRSAAGDAMSSRDGAVGEPPARVIASFHIRTLAPVR